jgi:hypothetical protein
MGGGIDAAGKPRDRGETRRAEFMDEALRDLQSRGRGVAGADDRDRRQGQCRAMAPHREQRRRIVKSLQVARIIRLADGDESRAQFLCRLKLALGLGARINLRRPAAAAAARERGKRLYRRSCTAEVINQRAKRARARYYGANAGSPNPAGRSLPMNSREDTG